MLLQIFTGYWRDLGHATEDFRSWLHRGLHRSGPIGEAQSRLKFQAGVIGQQDGGFGVEIGEAAIKKFLFTHSDGRGHEMCGVWKEACDWGTDGGEGVLFFCIASAPRSIPGTRSPPSWLDQHREMEYELISGGWEVSDLEETCNREFGVYR